MRVTLDLSGFDGIEQRVTDKMNAAIDGTVREVVTRIFETAQEISPVHTGNYRANWQILKDGDAFEQLPIDSAPDEQIGRIESDPAPGESAWIVGNAVPYAELLERGSSKQAPAGVLNISVAAVEAELPAIIAEQTRKAFG